MSMGRKVAAFARAPRDYGIRQAIRALESRARQHADAAAGPWSPSSWLVGIAARVARVIATELRIRRDTRELMTWSDQMLKDIGLTRAEVGSSVRYGRG
jgi:uncharacterized protein YjiS (DUF1127 family)